MDSAVYPGYTIPPFYDSMIAKIIVHGENRFDALMKMQRALYELDIEGSANQCRLPVGSDFRPPSYRW